MTAQDAVPLAGHGISGQLAYRVDPMATAAGAAQVSRAAEFSFDPSLFATGIRGSGSPPAG